VYHWRRIDLGASIWGRGSLAIETPYLMFLGDVGDQLAAKTAAGVAQWRPDQCVGQLRLDGCKADIGLPDMTLEQAVDAGARTVIVGVANQGGFLVDSWVASLRRALELGLDLASGLHVRLVEVPELAEAAGRLGRQMHDVRHPTREFTVGTGKARPGKRLLTVGTDVSVGKMYTALAIEAEMRRRGMKADFRATGQTGIFIVGDGVSVDAVVADFISGATEWLTPANDADHWDVVEGQGSLYHPSFAGVSLGLLHGSRPDALVMCHDPQRPHTRGIPGRPLPDIKDCIGTNIGMAAMVNPAVRCVGIALNTKAMDAAEADGLCASLADQLDLPCVDPLRHGVAAIVDALD
jgi:uncharacterized NAD-dependent epimerase/dehydratase family protein